MCVNVFIMQYPLSPPPWTDYLYLGLVHIINAVTTFKGKFYSLVSRWTNLKQHVKGTSCLKTTCIQGTEKGKINAEGFFLFLKSFLDYILFLTCIQGTENGKINAEGFFIFLKSFLDYILFFFM